MSFVDDHRWTEGAIFNAICDVEADLYQRRASWFDRLSRRFHRRTRTLHRAIELLYWFRAERSKWKGIVDAHDLCHDKDGTVGACEFAAGCADMQRELFKCAPDADAVQRLRTWITRRVVRDIGAAQWCSLCEQTGGGEIPHRPTCILYVPEGGP